MWLLRVFLVNMVLSKPERIWVGEFSGAKPHLMMSIVFQAVAMGERRFPSGQNTRARAGALLVVGLIIAGWYRSGAYYYSLGRSGSQLSNGVWNVLGRVLCAQIGPGYLHAALCVTVSKLACGVSAP